MTKFDDLTRTQMNDWVKFLELWPSGEDAQDIRFNAIRHDIYEIIDQLRYVIGTAHGCKEVSEPTKKRLSQFSIFKRWTGPPKEAEPQNVAASMKKFGMALARRNKG